MWDRLAPGTRHPGGLPDRVVDMSLPGALGRIAPTADVLDVVEEHLSTPGAVPPELLVPVDQAHPSSCMDGRPFDVEVVDLPHHSRRTPTSPVALPRTPRVAGGTLSTWVTDLLATGLFRPEVSQDRDPGWEADDMRLLTPSSIGEDLQSRTPAWLSLTCASMRAAGLPVSIHTDDHAHAPDCGCGAADSLRTILALIGQRPQGLATLMEQWGTDPADLPDVVVQRCSAFALTLPAGDDLAGIIAGYADTVLPVMHGDHHEIAVIANPVEGTTVDPHALQRLCGVGQAHCFIVDTWSFTSVADFLEDTARRTSTPLTLTREQVMATTCAFNAAAVLTLSAPTMPSWVVPH